MAPSAVPATPVPTVPDGWRRQPVDAADVAVHLPPDWLTFGSAELADDTTRATLEDRFPGASGLFEAVEAQGSRVELLFVGVDPSGRGSPAIPATVAVVEVESRVPTIGLQIGAGLVLDGLDAALDIETEPERERVTTPVGEAVTFAFDHRVADEGAGPGIRARLDGALVTSADTSFLVLRNVDESVDDALVPSLDEVLGAMRDLP